MTTTEARACGCTSRGVVAVDTDRHAAWHALTAQQTGPTSLAGRGMPKVRGARRTVDGEPVRYVPPPPPRTTHAGAALDRARTDTGLDHPRESHAAAAGALSRSGTLRATVLALVAARAGDGATSDEVERHTGRAHQSVSATLYGLEKDGLATRTGPVRRTGNGEDARAYVVTSHGTSELRRLRVPHPGAW